MTSVYYSRQVIIVIFTSKEEGALYKRLTLNELYI